MLRILRSRPLSNSFSFYGRPFSSNISANPPKEAIISSSSSSSESLINDQAPSAPPSEPAAKKSSSAFLKFAIFGTLAGATAAAGYASYGSFLDCFLFCSFFVSLLE